MIYWLRSIGEEERYTQTLLAKKLGVSRQAYNNYESQRRKISPEIAKKISELLDFEKRGLTWTKFYDDDPSRDSSGDDTA